MGSITLYIVPAILVLVPLLGLLKKLPVYELFVTGAAEGLRMSVQILRLALKTVEPMSVLQIQCCNTPHDIFSFVFIFTGLRARIRLHLINGSSGQ